VYAESGHAALAAGCAMTIVGKGKPPKETRFRPGQSGNPMGRPRGRSRTLPYDAVLGQMVTVIENGRERRLAADQAFLLHIAKAGITTGGPTGRAALEAIESARKRRGDEAGKQIQTIVLQLVGVGDVAPALRPLRMATLLDPYRPSGRLVLQPWLVEAALTRMGDRRLTPAEQRAVYAATRTPHKVRWPSWWMVED
jgi:hypothetical protein